ncbi:MAG: GNAT family N-acetyltransferase [Actinomycetota bacterium]
MRLVEPDTPGAIAITVWDLVMASPPATEVDAAPVGVEVVEATEPAPDLSAFYYRAVGRDWQWVDRESWTDAQWLAWVDRPEHHLHTLSVAGAPGGYVELEQQDGGAVEIAYFGLTPKARGHGLGRWFLSYAIAIAWALPGTSRLWLHTCSLDGPAALPNYLNRGFEVSREYTEWRRPS